MSKRGRNKDIAIVDIFQYFIIIHNKSDLNSLYIWGKSNSESPLISCKLYNLYLSVS